MAGQPWLYCPEPRCTAFFSGFPVDTGRKLNVHKTFRRRPGRLMNVLCTKQCYLGINVNH